MTKLKLRDWSHVGDVLTSEELKVICGGADNGSVNGPQWRCYLRDRIDKTWKEASILSVTSYGSCMEQCAISESHSVLYDAHQCNYI